MMLLAQFILFSSARHAQGAPEQSPAQYAQLRSPGQENILNESVLDKGGETTPAQNEIALPESPEDFEMPSSDDFEMPQEDEKKVISPQQTKDQPIYFEEETRQARDTCSQMLQFPFLEHVIERTSLSGDLSYNFKTLPREQAFEVMREILIRRGFSGFAYWKNSQAVMREWYLNFVYNVLENDGLVESDSSPESRLESLELGGYISHIWIQENCACYEDILGTFNDLIITEILGRNQPKGLKHPFPYYQGTERELLEADLINIITTASGLGKRMYMSRQGISEENFCHIQRELLLRSGYNEFAGFDCISYVRKEWYTDFLYYILSGEMGTENLHNIQDKGIALVKNGYLPSSATYRQNIYEQDIYQVINNPVFLEALVRKETKEAVASEEETIPEFPDVYEEPISPVR